MFRELNNTVKNESTTLRHLKWSIIISGLVFMLLGTSDIFSQELSEGMNNQPTADAISKGKELYDVTCAYCHGLDGKGDGPAADFLIPAPRDFSEGVYKFRHTPSGSIPSDRDLYESITKGIHGTSMIRWRELPEKQRWWLVHYIKTFSDKFLDEKNPPVITVSEPPRLTRESIMSGRQFYIDAECWKCHGESGRGDGPSANELKDKDGNISIPRDLTIGKNYGRGSSREAIYITLISGLDGTPMPSYQDAFEDMDEELWNLVNYIYSLTEE